MRCSSTNTFASYDEAEADVESVDLSGNILTLSYRLYRPCAECGSEAAEYSGDIGVEFDHACDLAAVNALRDFRGEDPLPEGEEPEPEFNLFEEPYSLDVEDYSQTTDRRGKPIRNPRYQRHLFAVSADATVRCETCGEDFVVTIEERDIAASYFEDTGH